MKLKADFHLHTSEDPQDSDIEYNSFELINIAKERKFDVLAIANHNELTYDHELKEYASERGVVLIPGMEKTIEGRHILFLNADFTEVKKVEFIEDIKYLKDQNSFIVAPHPFFPSKQSLNSKLERHIELFDAIEYTGFYFKYLNFNKKAERLTSKYGLPLIGSSDAHFISQLGLTYSLIEAEKNIESIIQAVKAHRIEIVSRPMALNFKNLKLASIFFTGAFYTY